MEKLVARIGILMFVCFGVGTHSAQAQKQMEVFLDYKTYYVQGQGALVDVQFQYVGYTLKHVTDSLGLHSAVGVQTLIKDESGKTVKEMAYALNGPILKDSIITDLFDAQQFILTPGKYTADITLIDMNTDLPPISGALDIIVPNRAGKVEFSDLLIAEEARPSNTESPLNKSGYEIIPRLSNFFGPEDMKIPYYIELYNSHMFGDSVVGVMQRVIDANGQEVQGFSKVSRVKTSPVVSYIRSMDIENLPSGSYKLELSIIDKATMLPTPTRSVYFFDRINDKELTVDIENIILDPNFQSSITDDSLGYYLASLLPIAKMTETKNILAILKSKDKVAARKHIQQFWVVTSGAKAYDSWMEYKKNVQMVQKFYATNFQDGFETDRGRVYLQYGPPNQITSRESSPTEYPYEIWQYDAIKVYRNRRFVFYNPDLVNNNYRLLHSDMVGELQNRMWQQALVKRNTPDGNIDDPNVQSVHGGNSGVLYKQF